MPDTAKTSSLLVDVNGPIQLDLLGQRDQLSISKLRESTDGAIKVIESSPLFNSVTRERMVTALTKRASEITELQPANQEAFNKEAVAFIFSLDLLKKALNSHKAVEQVFNAQREKGDAETLSDKILGLFNDSSMSQSEQMSEVAGLLIDLNEQRTRKP